MYKPKAMENHSSENGELCQKARDAEKNDGIADSDENLIRDDECRDFCVFIDSSKAAKLQRTLKWAGLKLVSWSGCRFFLHLQL